MSSLLSGSLGMLRGDAQNRRYPAVPVFRAVVCLQILVMHCYFGGINDTITVRFGAGVSWAVSHVRFGFESFFVLAGYFLAHSFRPGYWSYLSVSQYLRRRILRLCVPYWAAILLGIATYQVSAWVRGRHYTPPPAGDLFAMALFVQDLFSTNLTAVTHWFMAPLMQFYILWTLAFWVGRQFFIRNGDASYHNRAVRVISLLMAVSLAGSLVFAAGRGESRWALPHHATFLCLGCLTYWREDPLLSRIAGIGIICTTAVGLSVADSRLVAGAACAMLLLIAGHETRLPDSAIFRALTTFSHWTYSIYLTQTYVIYRVLNLRLLRTEPLTPLQSVLIWILAVVASIAGGWVFYRLVERPLSHLSSKISYRRGGHPG